MVSVKLRNLDIILTSINDEEKKQIESDFMSDESIYVLYRLANSEKINIGMISKYCPYMANVWNLNSATSLTFFYNGCSELENNAFQITDKPVYKIKPSNNRMIY